MINALKEKCLNYFLDKSKFEQAFNLSLEIGRKDLVLRAFEMYRLACFNTSRLQSLVVAYQQIQKADLRTQPITQITSPWIMIAKGDTLGMMKEIDNIDETNLTKPLQAEYLVLKAYGHYVKREAEKSLEAALKANELSMPNLYAKGFMYIFLIGSLQMLGKDKEAFSKGIEALSIETDSTVKSQILLVLCYISRFMALQQNLFDFSRSLLSLSELNNNIESKVNASTFLAEYYYNKGELKSAERLLKGVFDYKEYTIGVIKMSMIWLYAHVLNMIGKKEQALEVVQEEIEHYTTLGIPFIVEYYKGMRAHLQMLSENTNEALTWAKSTELDPRLPVTEMYTPIFTQYLIFSDQPEQEHFQSLNTLLELHSLTENKRAYAEGNILLSLFYLNKKQPQEAANALLHALPILPLRDFKFIYDKYSSQSGEFKDLIVTLAEKSNQVVFSKKVKITNREHQILALYNQKLTDQEMANKLGISLATVKRHNVNIFNKLEVSSKRHALEVYKNI